MTASQLPLGLAQPHNNQQLFADHYLNVVLPERPEWRALFDEAAQAQADIRAIFADYTSSSNEYQTEDGLIKPVLALLGHTFEVQAALRTPRGTKKPDYVFYQDAAARASNKDLTLTDAALIGKAYAVGDAKYWNRPLDVSLKLRSSDPDMNKVPSDQIAFYMLHSGMTWAFSRMGGSGGSITRTRPRSRIATMRSTWRRSRCTARPRISATSIPSSGARPSTTTR